MTLDDAIAHAEEKAKDCATECGREHQQLAGWLRELSTARTAIAKLCDDYNELNAAAHEWKQLAADLFAVVGRQTDEKGCKHG